MFRGIWKQNPVRRDLIQRLHHMQSSVTNENLADYSNFCPLGSLENTIRLLIGGTLVAYGLSKRSKTGLAMAAVGTGIASVGLMPTTADGENVPAVPRKRMVRRAITILRPQSEVYEFWSKPENLQRIFPRIASIAELPDRRWRWKVNPIGSYKLDWETEPIVSEPPNLMSWKSVRESPLEQAGSVKFSPAPGGKGTEVQMTVSWLATGPMSGVALPFLGKGSAWHASETLRRAKQLLETGELTTAEFAA
jgi:uncharacterized membrane protein